MILPFPNATTATTSAIACYIRIRAAHQKLAELLAAFRLPATRIVVDASRAGRHRELTTALRETGAEIILDTEVAGLAAPAKFAGPSRGAPRNLPSIDGPLSADHFRRNPPMDVADQIARFAIRSNFDVILSPTHFPGDLAFDDWLAVDRESCLLLREAPDREGGAKRRLSPSQAGSKSQHRIQRN
jgi:hypothetical protein